MNETSARKEKKKNWYIIQKHVVCKHCSLPTVRQKALQLGNFNFTCHSNHFIFNAIDLNISSLMKSMADKTFGNITFYIQRE